MVSEGISGEATKIPSLLYLSIAPVKHWDLCTVFLLNFVFLITISGCVFFSNQAIRIR